MKQAEPARRKQQLVFWNNSGP